MSIVIVFLLCVTLLMPFTLDSADNGPDNILIYLKVSDHLKGIGRGRRPKGIVFQIILPCRSQFALSSVTETLVPS